MAGYLGDMTKQELLALAAERHIDVRSSMSKAELVAALESTADTVESPAGDNDSQDAAEHQVFDGVDQTEAARVDDAQSSHVDEPYPDDMPGPRPPRSAPADPNALMSSLGEA